MSTPQLALSLDTLGNWYSPLEIGPSANGWNLDGSAYFLSQGSEYELQPPQSYNVGSLSDGQIKAMQDTLKALQEQAQGNAGVSPQTQANLNAAVAWSQTVTPSTPVDALQTSFVLTHIRNNQQNDTATLKMMFITVPPIGQWLLTEGSLTIDWGGIGNFPLADNVATAIRQNGKTASRLISLADMYAETGLGSAVSIALYALAALSEAMKICTNLGNDGGRLNFLAVIFHAINRVAASVTPAAEAAAGAKTPTLAIGKLGYTWSAQLKDSTVMAGSGVYAEHRGTGSANGNCPTVGMPELSWAPGGVVMLATIKQFSIDPSPVYIKHLGVPVPEVASAWGLTMLLVGRDGEIVAASAAIEPGEGSGTLIYPSPVFSETIQDAQNNLTLALTAAAEKAGGGSGGKAPYAGAAGMAAQALTDTLTNMAGAVGLTSDTWNTLPQPAALESIAFQDSTTVLSSNTGPALAFDPSANAGNALVLISVKGSGDLCSQIGSIQNDFSISWTDADSDYNHAGYAPSVAVTSDGWVIEVHQSQSSGGVSAELDYNIGLLQAGSLTWKVTGKKYGAGVNPHISMNGNTILEVHDNGDPVDPKLYYDVGQFNPSGPSITWGSTNSSSSSGTGYGSGSNPAVVLSPSGAVTEVHDNGDGADPGLFYLYGQLTGTTISWGEKCLQGGIPYGSGAQPCIVVRPNGLVVEVHSNLDNNLGSVYYQYAAVQSDGQLKWAANGQSYGSGDSAAIALAANGQMAEAHYDGGVKASVVELTFPQQAVTAFEARAASA